MALRNDYPLAHLNLGNVRREQGRLAAAAAAYERALALSPNLVAARFNLGNVLAEQRRWDEAIACYSRFWRPSRTMPKPMAALAAR